MSLAILILLEFGYAIAFVHALGELAGCDANISDITITFLFWPVWVTITLFRSFVRRIYRKWKMTG